MTPDYVPFVDRMITKYEGGYGWDKADPGGPTNFGITCYDLAEHRGQKMTSMSAWVEPVKTMPRAEAEAIYAKKYAAALRFEDLGPGKDTVLFDYGVNSGDSRPIRVARALLKLPAGGVMTTDLVTAINKADAKWFINAVCDERLSFMHAIRGGSAWTSFGKGWGARVSDLRTYSIALAAVTPQGDHRVVMPEIGITPGPKANHDSPKAATTATSSTGGAVVVAGATAYATGMPTWAVVLIVAGVIVIGVVAALYEIRKNTAANAAVVVPITVPPQPKNLV